MTLLDKVTTNTVHFSVQCSSSEQTQVVPKYSFYHCTSTAVHLRTLLTGTQVICSTIKNVHGDSLVLLVPQSCFQTVKDLPSLWVWPGDSRYATDSPALMVHHQNLRESCKFK